MFRNAFSHEVSQSELNYLRSQGLNNQQIAQRVGCSRGTISKYLPSQRKPRVRLSQEDRQDILKLYNDGESVKDIADAYSCHITTIYDTLKALGAEIIRGKKQAKPKEEPTPEPNKEAAFEQAGSHSAKMTVYQIGLYDGRYGVYKVNLTEHKVEFPDLPKTMEKQELGFYIRDLMEIWKEM